MAFLSKICWMQLHNIKGQYPPRPQQERRMFMIDNSLPLGFGFALNQNTAAMIRYAHLDQQEKQNILKSMKRKKEKMMH